eukprot:3143080-Prorocentrum_lima.AAC.1
MSAAMWRPHGARHGSPDVAYCTCVSSTEARGCPHVQHGTAMQCSRWKWLHVFCASVTVDAPRRGMWVWQKGGPATGCG